MRYCKQFAIGKLPIIVFSFFMFSDVNAHFKNFNFKHPLADTTKKIPQNMRSTKACR
jgi:hypothetical protein